MQAKLKDTKMPTKRKRCKSFVLFFPRKGEVAFEFILNSVGGCVLAFDDLFPQSHGKSLRGIDVA